MAKIQDTNPNAIAVTGFFTTAPHGTGIWSEANRHMVVSLSPYSPDISLTRQLYFAL